MASIVNSLQRFALGVALAVGVMIAGYTANTFYATAAEKQLAGLSGNAPRRTGLVFVVISYVLALLSLWQFLMGLLSVAVSMQKIEFNSLSHLIPK